MIEEGKEALDGDLPDVAVVPAADDFDYNEFAVLKVFLIAELVLLEILNSLVWLILL